MGVSGQFHVLPVLLLGTNYRLPTKYYANVGSRADVDALEKTEVSHFCQESEDHSPVAQHTAQSLYSLFYLGSL